MKIAFLLAIFLMGIAQGAETATIRPLLMEALRSPSGTAHGTLSGPLAQAISQRFQSTAPIQIRVRTLSRFATPGCSRLRVGITQDQVKLPDHAQPQSQTLALDLNYCLNGLPPPETRKAAP